MASYIQIKPRVFILFILELDIECRFIKYRTLEQLKKLCFCLLVDVLFGFLVVVKIQPKSLYFRH